MSNSKFKIQNSKFPPPWRLTGSAALLLSKSGSAALVHYDSSPVGPYNEWARIVLTWQGPRVVEMLVTSEEARVGGVENWGFPKQIGNLGWQQRGAFNAPNAARVKFHKGSQIYHLRAWGPRFPVAVKFFCVQTLKNHDVRVPFSLKGKARLAWRGAQMALLLEEFVFVVEAPER